MAPSFADTPMHAPRPGADASPPSDQAVDLSLGCARRRTEMASRKKLRTIVLLAAIHQEMTAIIQSLGLTEDPHGQTHIGQIDGVHLVCALTGVGPDRAVAIFQRLVHVHQPDLVIHLGFAGALDPRLRTGDVITFRAIINGRGKTVMFEDGLPYVTDDEIHRKRHHTLLTAATLITDPKQKRVLFEKYRAGACDMESFALAQSAAHSRVRLLVVRAVSDAAHEALPKGMDRWIRSDGSVDLKTVMIRLLKNPRLIATLWRLRRSSRLAGKRLAQHISPLIRKLTD